MYILIFFPKNTFFKFTGVNGVHNSYMDHLQEPDHAHNHVKNKSESDFETFTLSQLQS